MPSKIPKKQKYRTKVKRGINGLGLFAAEPIPKDEFVIEYFGIRLTDEEADEKGGKYLFDTENGVTVDGSPRENIARYINHSCKPNCEPEIDGKRVFVYTLRDIEKGEELTYDYGKEYFNDHIKPYGCKCPYCQKA